MLRYYFLFQGLPVPDVVIVGIVDEVIVPLLTDSRMEHRDNQKSC